MKKEFQQELDDLHNSLMLYKQKESVLTDQIHWWCRQFIPRDYQIGAITFDRGICYITLIRKYLNGLIKKSKTYNLNQLENKFKK